MATISSFTASPLLSLFIQIRGDIPILQKKTLYLNLKCLFKLLNYDSMENFFFKTNIPIMNMQLRLSCISAIKFSLLYYFRCSKRTLPYDTVKCTVFNYSSKVFSFLVILRHELCKRLYHCLSKVMLHALFLLPMGLPITSVEKEH